MDILTSDITLETFRALVAAGLFVYMWQIGREGRCTLHAGWNWLLAGFGLLLVGSILDLTDNFPGLNHFVIIGDTHTEAFLEKVVGYLGGFVALFIGFRRWLPLVLAGESAQQRLELAESQNRYRDLVELSPDAIILHKDGRILYANAAAAEIIDSASPDDLIGRSVMDFIHPDHKQRSMARLQLLADGQQRKVPLIDLKLITIKGEERDVEVASGVTDFKGERAFQSVLRDATERTHAERALKQSERDLRSIFENMAEFYYRADLNGRIVRASGAAKEVTGWDHEEILGLQLGDRYVDPEGRAKFLTALKNRNGRVRNYEALLERRDGEQIWVSTNAQYYRDEDGEISGVEGTVRDISENVQARDVLQHMALHDVLTGLANRRSLEARIKEAIPRAKRANIGGALLYFDLDGFKAVNDTYGHDFGDAVLRKIGARIHHMSRETDFTARIGGDEFCLVIEGAADRTAIERVAEKLIEILITPYELQNITVTLGVSVGILPFDGSEDPANLHAMLVKADKAMYQAKTEGGNTYRFVS